MEGEGREGDAQASKEPPAKKSLLPSSNIVVVVVVIFLVIIVALVLVLDECPSVSQSVKVELEADTRGGVSEAVLPCC